MTWNIRFGAGRILWFGDSCGDRVLFSEDEIYSNLNKIADKINELQPDILLLQEVDLNSKKSAYIDQLQWLLDRTYFNYASYAHTWKAQFVPSDGLGRIDEGNAILSRWKIENAIRIQLPRRGDQDGLTRYFYLQQSVLKSKINVPGTNIFYVLNAHLTAFSTDDTKKKQVNVLYNELNSLDATGAVFIAGGDFNLLPPNSDSTDYCIEDMCPDESFHGKDDNPKHKEGSNYTPEITWLQKIYDKYIPAVSLEKYGADQQHYFTHGTSPDYFWDRKLDYLFTNTSWIANSEVTHQEVIKISDHAALSALWRVSQ